MDDQQKVVYGLSNGAIFNDLQQPLTQAYLGGAVGSVAIRAAWLQ